MNTTWKTIQLYTWTHIKVKKQRFCSIFRSHSRSSTISLLHTLHNMSVNRLHSTVIYKSYIQDQDIQSNFKGVFYLTDSLNIVSVVLYRHHVILLFPYVMQCWFFVVYFCDPRATTRNPLTEKSINIVSEYLHCLVRSKK
jgi:hypothetical protein